ncbi:MAG: TdeIII family type II restriction endonuclease [Prevotellaceae bacterium]|jgi:hypothetical protein|nr:TdeIII family type II restriction endonuclease [Prevotellaceae bacterium]
MKGYNASFNAGNVEVLANFLKKGVKMNNLKKEKISIEVIKTLVARFENFPEDASNNRNAPFHEAFLQAFSDKLQNSVSDVPFFLSLASWLHGLNTTLGQSFFENVAHILCNGEKREYTSKKLGNKQITKKQQENITKIITDLSNSSKSPSLEYENALLLQNDYTEKITASDFSADVFFETENEVVAIELKTVKPNSGGMMGEKQKILEGKSALYHLFPNKKINFFFGFPFDPTVNPALENVTGYDKTRFLNSVINANKFVAQNEVLLANELWNYLSGEQNTMEDILQIINTIATTDFLLKLQLLKDNSKRNTPEYLNQLTEWNLFSEINLIQNDAIIRQNLNKEDLRIYNKLIFDNNGKYNWERYNCLEKRKVNN